VIVATVGNFQDLRVNVPVTIAASASLSDVVRSDDEGELERRFLPSAICPVRLVEGSALHVEHHGGRGLVGVLGGRQSPRPAPPRRDKDLEMFLVGVRARAVEVMQDR
jgi:hypothetical protein